ncbi:MAG TPA: hypothetical protein VH391_03040 [Solirubrobacterales bacterium]|jgi:hypothetical protein
MAAASARAPGGATGSVVAVDLIAGGREKAAARGPVASVHESELLVTEEYLQRVLSMEVLRQISAAYWRFLRRISLGLLRKHAESTHESLVVVLPRAALLRFQSPRYQEGSDSAAVTWPIDRGLLVAPEGRGRGSLRISLQRVPSSPRRPRQARVLMRMEVVGYYPWCRGRGWFAPVGTWLYAHTQAEVHRLVLRGFMRSLAGLELPSAPAGVAVLRESGGS